MRILITGGAGFVGRHFCRYFLETNNEVVCVDPIIKYTGGIEPVNWPFFNPYDFKNFYFHKMDCRDFFRSDAGEYDLVLHLAAMVGGRLMIDNNPLAVAEDLAIDAMYWKWARDVKIKKTLYFSSSAAYPVHLQTQRSHRLLKEDDIDFGEAIGVPDMTYGWAKLTGEFLAKVAHEKHGLRSVIYRPFSGYGEDQDLTYPFPAICQRALNYENDTIFSVWGSGLQMRDFVHISDCVRCVIETYSKVDDARAINISSGVLTSFTEFAGKVLSSLGHHNVTIKGTTNTPEGVFARGGDTGLQERLGFRPSIALDDGIRRCIQFLSQKT